MIDSVILGEPVLIVITVAALAIVIAARFASNRYICGAMYITSFLCVMGCTVYSLLLGVELRELLAYILIFVLVGTTAFFPSYDEHGGSDNGSADGGGA